MKLTLDCKIVHLQFMMCPYNLANNRQTRMLADLSIVGCYNSTLSSTDRDRLMLASAKHNLQFMPFFMLTEYQKVCIIHFVTYI